MDSTGTIDRSTESSIWPSILWRTFFAWEAIAMKFDRLREAVCGGHESEYLRRKQEERYARLVVLEAEFLELFDQDLHLYCDRLVGFDSCRFWAATVGETPDGTSYDDAVRDRYGRRAAELVLDLIRARSGGGSDAE
jgi:phosphoribosylaminoimidazole-succinocarboxamide synthase